MEGEFPNRLPPGAPHPAERDLRRLLLGELPRLEAGTVVRHLLTGCPRCLRVAREIWNRGELPPCKAFLKEATASPAPRRARLRGADGR